MELGVYASIGKAVGATLGSPFGLIPVFAVLCYIIRELGKPVALVAVSRRLFWPLMIAALVVPAVTAIVLYMHYLPHIAGA